VRQTLTDTGSVSSPVKIVDPVVVSPDTASKYACVNESGRPTRAHASSSGSAAARGSTDQASETSITPWRGSSSRRQCRRPSVSAPPAENAAAMAIG